MYWERNFGPNKLRFFRQYHVCDLIWSVPLPYGGRNAFLIHMCPVGRGLKRTGGQTEGRIVKRDSQDEFSRPPHCLCCCKRNASWAKQKFFNNFSNSRAMTAKKNTFIGCSVWKIFINFVQAANALDVQKILTPKNEVAALSCKNGKANLAKDTEVFSTINWSQPLR